MRHKGKTMQATSSRFAALLIPLAIVSAGTLSTTASHSASTSMNCSELVVNGGFETGSQGWTQMSAGGYDLISDFNPFTGVWGAYLGGIDDAEDRLSQTVNLPAGTTSITLHAWWSIATTETGGAFDWMTLSLLRPDGTLLSELLRVNDSAEPNVWDEVSVDLVPFAGQQVILQGQARTDGSNPTDFYLDDVSITACTSARRGYLPLVVATTRNRDLRGLP